MADKDRLLTDKEITSIISRTLKDNPHWEIDAWGLYGIVAQEQDSKTASIIRVGCDAEMLELAKQIGRDSFDAGVEAATTKLRAEHKNNIASIFEEIDTCKIRTDVFQEDGSKILSKGDIVIPQLYYEHSIKSRFQEEK